MENKKMEIVMKEDEDDIRTFAVIINNKFFLNSSYIFQNRWKYRWIYYVDESLKDWIQNIRRIYTNKKNRKLLVALCADRSLSYTNGTFSKGGKKDDPYELLQLCVGTHCMVHELNLIHGVHKVLKDFFYDKNTIVIGVGIEKVAAKLQKDFGIMFNECVELRTLAADANKGSEDKDFNRVGVAELAKLVTGGEIDYVRPKSMRWWPSLQNYDLIRFRKKHRWDPRDYYDREEFLSMELLRHATVEVFLVQHIGDILLNKD